MLKKDLIHRDIVCFCGNIVEKLERKAKPYLLARDEWQDSVVVASSPTQPMSVLVESHARYDSEVNVGIVAEDFTSWLHDAESTFLHQFRLIDAQLQVIADNHRQKNSLQAGILEQQCVGGHLVGQ